ncbi:hypothetical protein HAPAU_34280 [Halalkalicoccus paucihalophilus]|uniref:Uncharacterized protein n=1 Tax=Halalkalicoccus paucihalophilus TaxID=1008153 RepID=A0A151A9Y1_9EURY|nr:hypothetical protein HAPAU_34280 [Halalkalicoccus paucihalophilus]
MDIYKEYPVFYSLGDFGYGTEIVERPPTENFDYYDVSDILPRLKARASHAH